MPLTCPTFNIPFGETWLPVCQAHTAQVPEGFRCFTSAGLERVSPREVVFVWVRFADLGNVQVVANHGTLQPDLRDRIAQLSVAVLADNGQPGTD